MVSIRLLDHGIGIAPEVQPHVLNLFVQADQARARSNAGMGIGLNLVKRIVELHGGTDAFKLTSTNVAIGRRDRSRRV